MFIYRREFVKMGGYLIDVGEVIFSYHNFTIPPVRVDSSSSIFLWTLLPNLLEIASHGNLCCFSSSFLFVLCLRLHNSHHSCCLYLFMDYYSSVRIYNFQCQGTLIAVYCSGLSWYGLIWRYISYIHLHIICPLFSSLNHIF